MNTTYYAVPINWDNYKKTILHSVDLSNYNSICFKSGYSNNLRVWGLSKRKFNRWREINESDILFFYHKGCIVSYCTILNVCDDLQLAEKLWGSFYGRNGRETWQYLLALSPPIFCNIKFKKFNSIIGYDTNYSLRTFVKLPVKFADYIGEHYLTLDKFISAESYEE